MTRPKIKSRLGAEERRAAIVAVAGPIFARHGYAGTRLEDIAEAAGVTKPIVYRHFGSKSGLYLALLEKHRSDLPLFFAEAMQTSPPPATGDSAALIERVLSIWLDYVRENGHNWVLLFRDVGGDEEIRAMRTRVSRDARAVMATFLASRAGDEIPTEQIEPTAEFLTSGLAGLALWATDHPEIPKPTLQAVALRFALAGIQGEGGKVRGDV